MDTRNEGRKKPAPELPDKSPAPPPPRASRRERFLHGLLALTVAAPALAFFSGLLEGEIAFTLYREPKLIVIQILGGFFLSALFWLRRERLSAENLLAVLSRPPVLLLTAFLLYLAITGGWTRVFENYAYELNQYALLYPLLIAIVCWSAGDARVASTIERALIASLALVTLTGLAQRLGAVSFLHPINPASGVLDTSLMGYKNPLALALLGQLFLLARQIFDRSLGAGLRAAALALLVLELIYLASLESRTSYVALFAGFLFLSTLAAIRRPSGLARARLVLAGAGLLAIFTSAVAAHRPTREKMGTVLSYAAHPRSYLESDRGTYLLNTLNMVRHHPFGVGLGDWQTHYPVYRLHQRSRFFTAELQVRRAHSDHVQFLGEAGWPGWLLWSGFLIGLTAHAVLRYGRSRRSRDLFVAAQLVALITAMATDFVLEMPYHKFQFFMIVALVLSRHRAPPQGRRILDGRPLPRAIPVGIALIALLNLAVQAGAARKTYLSAAMTGLYLEAVEGPGRAGRPANVALLRRAVAYGAAFDAWPGLSKTRFRDYLVLAHAHSLLGHRELALVQASRALALHPFHPNTFRLMASLADDPELAERWRHAHRYLVDEATRGFEISYPASPVPASPGLHTPIHRPAARSHPLVLSRRS